MASAWSTARACTRDHNAGHMYRAHYLVWTCRMLNVRHFNVMPQLLTGSRGPHLAKTQGARVIFLGP